MAETTLLVNIVAHINRFLLSAILMLAMGSAHGAFPDDFDGVILEDTGEASGIRGFAVTANLEATVTSTPINSFGRGIILDSDKRNSWPRGPGIVSCCNANAWIFAKFGDQWHGHTFEFLRVGQTTKSEAALGPTHYRGSQPWVSQFNYNTTGAIYGFMVSGITRNGPGNLNISERSNISWWKWGVGPIDACEAVPENPNCGGAPQPDESSPQITPIILDLMDD